MQNDAGAGNSMLKNRLAECLKRRTNGCAHIQRNKRMPACWAVMDKGRIVEGSCKSSVTMWL